MRRQLMKHNAKRANFHSFWLSLAYRTNKALIKLDSFTIHIRKRAVCKARNERQLTKCTIEICERHDNSDAFQNDVSHKKQQNVLNKAIYRANLGEYKLMQRRISNAQMMAFVRANQTDDQRILRDAQMARQVALRRVQESFDETERRREANARYMATARSFLNDDEVNQIRIRETQNRLLKSNLMAETTNKESLRFTLEYRNLLKLYNLQEMHSSIL
jgi:hypothetical protein